MKQYAGEENISGILSLVEFEDFKSTPFSSNSDIPEKKVDQTILSIHHSRNQPRGQFVIPFKLESICHQKDPSNQKFRPS